VRELLVKVEPLGWRLTGLVARLLWRIEREWKRLSSLAEINGEPLAPAHVAREAEALRRVKDARARDPSR
jgi:hypothetical protein